jgi:hypothetical protein
MGDEKEFCFAMATLASSLTFTAPSFGGDRVMICEGPVHSTPLFQKVHGATHKVRIEKTVGDCPFTPSGDVGKQILRECLDHMPCRVTGPAPVVWAGTCVIAEYIWTHKLLPAV